MNIYGNFPLRSKNDCHSPQADYYADMTRRRPPSSVRACSSDYFSPSRRSDDLWDIPFCGTPPFGLDPFRSGRDLLYPPRSVPHDIRYNSLSRSSYDDHGVPFEKAAAEMYAALETADKELQTLSKMFNTQISGLTQWLSPNYIDDLWKIYMDWDGQPADPTAGSKAPRLASTSSTSPITYNDITKRIGKASDVLRHASSEGHPQAYHGPHSGAGFSSSLPNTRAKLSGPYGGNNWDDIGTTKRKLQVSLDLIDEHTEVVRQQRHRMEYLIREIVSAKQLLEEVRSIGDSGASRKKEGGTGQQRQRDTPSFWDSSSSYASSGVDI